MKRWEVVYYRSKNTIAFKTVYAKDGKDAAKKARVKNIIDLYPCIKEQKVPLDFTPKGAHC